MRIGYYAHHHGSGHCRQADKLAALLPSELRQQMTVFTSLPTDGYHFSTIADEQVVRLSAEDQLPEDVLPGRAGEYWQPSSLHYSPVGNLHVQTRSWQLLDGIRQRQIDIMIIDVSVEVATLCRAASVPYLYVRLAGERDDLPHLNAFAGALGLLAPYPKVLEAAATPDWVCQKTLYLDFMPNKTDELLTFTAFINKLMTLTADSTIHERLYSRLDSDDKSAEGNAKNNANEDNVNKGNIVTIIKGYGGHEAIDAKLPELRRALPSALIISLGPINDEARDFVDIAAHVDDVTPFVAHSDLLLMACGLNGIAQVYDYTTPLVVLPDARPHREQEVMAEALIEQGRALGWTQFIGRTSNLNSQKILSFFPTNNALINNNDKTDLIDNQSSMAAQDFMNSVADYVSVKAWFQEWLLPQLGLRPEK